MPRIRRAPVDDEVATTYSDLDRDTRSVDFLKDPDLFKDPLPQPYRRIDKILQELFDDVWEIVDKKDVAKRIEASKPRPNKYSSGSKIQDINEFNCMCVSTDEANEYIFVGSSLGVLACVDAAGMCVLAETDLSIQFGIENANITSISSSCLKCGPLHLVSCLSDTGCLFLSLFSGVRFLTIQSFIDPLTLPEKKTICRKVEISRNCDFLAALIENRNETFIEVFKCPKDVWCQTNEDVSRARNSNTQLSGAVVDSEPAPQNDSAGGAINSSIEMSASKIIASTSEILAKPSLVCRVRPSLNQIKFPTASQGLTPAQLFKSVEANGDLIGIGVNSCITRAYVDVKTQFVEKAFDVHLDDDSIGHLNGTKNYDLKIDADFKFLSSNRFFSTEQSIITPDLPVCLAVCWNHSNQFLFYPLTKVNKELESKFEYTLSFASGINQIELTKCNTRLAFVLRNSNLIVVNLNSGLSSSCDVSFGPNESLDYVGFVPINAAADSSMQTTSPQINISARLVGLTNIGRVFSIDTSDVSTYGRCVFQPQLVNKDDKIEFVTPLRNLPSLVMAVSATQKIYILDINKARLICELVANSAQSEIKPYTTAKLEAVYSSKNFQLFVKCVHDENHIGLVCHSLRLVSVLDDYLSVNLSLQASTLPVNALLVERVASLFRYKHEEESARRHRLNLIWDQLESCRNF